MTDKNAMPYRIDENWWWQSRVVQSSICAKLTRFFEPRERKCIGSTAVGSRRPQQSAAWLDGFLPAAGFYADLWGPIYDWVAGVYEKRLVEILLDAARTGDAGSSSRMFKLVATLMSATLRRTSARSPVAGGSKRRKPAKKNAVTPHGAATRWMVSRNDSTLTGLVRCSATPAARLMRMSSSVPKPLRAMPGRA